MIKFIIQHTPVVPRDSIHRDHSHNLVTELLEEFPLERLGEVVGDYFFGRTVLNRNFLSGNAIGNEEVSDVDVSSAFSTGRFPVFGQLNRALIVLVKDSADAVSLRLHKVFCP